MSYQRNQIEEALSRLFDPKSKAVRAELRTRIKRLFELDRSEQAKYAFFSDEALEPAPIFHSRSMMPSHRLMAHGWPQKS